MASASSRNYSDRAAANKCVNCVKKCQRNSIYGYENKRQTSETVSQMYKKAPQMLFRKRAQENWREEMNIRGWMKNWQQQFNPLGVEVIVADVGQSSVVVDAAERTVFLSPSLKLSAADRMLRKIYAWWQWQAERVEGQRCCLVAC